MIVAGNGIYDTCSLCKRLIKVNKFIFGSLHYCDSDNELEREKRLSDFYKDNTCNDCGQFYLGSIDLHVCFKKFMNRNTLCSEKEYEEMAKMLNFNYKPKIKVLEYKP
jgi:hypothetical protein